MDRLRDGALEVVTTLRARGFAALWAGGCVRDLALGRAPKDYDVATDARPEDVIALFPKTVPVGVAFGVVRVVLTDAREYEVATFRADHAYVDGRRPTGVCWADAREDAQRRDFTINGMFFDPVSAELLDFVGGQADLAERVLRAIGDPAARFGEDYLRLLRCVRFAARLGFAVDPATWDAVLALAPNVVRVSGERIREELERIVCDPQAALGVGLLGASGLLAAALPAVAAAPAATRLGALPASARSPTAAWAALLYDLPADAAGAEILRLKSSRALAQDVAAVVADAPRLGAWSTLAVAARKRLARKPTFAATLAVAASAGVDVAAATAAAAAWTPTDLNPAPLIGGDDLAALGHRPGPAFRAALEAVHDAQLEGRVTTRDEALALAIATLSPAPAAPGARR